MSNNKKDIEWLLENHGEFLQQFGIYEDSIIDGYRSWLSQNPTGLINNFFCDLLRQAGLYNAKNAKNEEDAYDNKLLLDTKLLEYAINLGVEQRNYLVSEIHFDRLNISRVTLPFKFDIQIESRDCCKYCSTRHKKTYTLAKVFENKYLPFTKCTRQEGCICCYKVIPLYDENGKLISSDFNH
jgi:hypothetical protein